MAIKVAINGFGRIGRNVLRTCLGDKDIDFVAVNDLTDTRTLAHLLKYDSVMGNLTNEISYTENTITVDGDEIRVFSEKDPAAIDWNAVGAEIVIESTGRFTKAEKTKTSRSCSASTRKCTIRRNTILSLTLRAPRIVSRRLRKLFTKNSVSKTL
jgi:glyceraldehyde-3-phosphate dehydrogenase/erythrose-4-phosphate dehydrogenase